MINSNKINYSHPNLEWQKILKEYRQKRKKQNRFYESSLPINHRLPNGQFSHQHTAIFDNHKVFNKDYLAHNYYRILEEERFNSLEPILPPEDYDFDPFIYLREGNYKNINGTTKNSNLTKTEVYKRDKIKIIANYKYHNALKEMLKFKSINFNSNIGDDTNIRNLPKIHKEYGDRILRTLQLNYPNTENKMFESFTFYQALYYIVNNTPIKFRECLYVQYLILKCNVILTTKEMINAQYLQVGSKQHTTPIYVEGEMPEEEIIKFETEIGYSGLYRESFTCGGGGSRFINNREELMQFYKEQQGLALQNKNIKSDLSISL